MEGRLIGDVAVQDRFDRAHVDAQAVEGGSGLFAHPTFDPDLVAFRRRQLVSLSALAEHCPAGE